MMRRRTATQSLLTRVVAMATMALLLPFLTESLATAATYYVSTAGSDSNPGTLSQPFLTIGKGLSVMTARDTLYIRAGTYAEFITSVPNGTSYADAPIISAYPGETVTLAPSGSSTAAVIDLVGPFHHVIFQNLRIDAAGVGYGGVVQGDVHHIRFQGVEIFNARHNGFLLPSVSTTTSTFIEFLSCNVHDNGFLFFEGQFGHGLYIGTSDNLVEGCAVHHNGAFGIHIFSGSAGLASNNTVRANDAHDNSTGTPTIGAGILLSSGNNNVAYNNITRGNAYGIIIGLGSNMKAYNNTIYSNTAEGITVRADSTNAQVRNNILWANGNAMTNGGSGTGMSNNLTTNPLFVNEPGGDFHLLSTSPAINAGMALAAVPTDKDGMNRPQGSAFDIGAYEFPTGDTTRFEDSATNHTPADAWVERGSDIATFIGGTAVSSDLAGATATFPFTGNAVSWHGLKCNLCGIASVSIDNGPPTSVDTAGTAAPGSPGLTSEVVFTSPTLAAGSHTMVITVTGTTSSGAAHIAVDAFDVTGEPPTADTRPPVVAVTSPTGGATVFETVTVTANASDTVGVMGVQFQLDGAPLGPEDTAAPYSRDWDTADTARGSHTLTATARDAAGNTSTASVTVTVSDPPPPDNTPPTVSITSPSSGSTVSGTTPVFAEASDNVRVVRVVFKLDGADPGLEDDAAPYSVSWDTTTTTDGAHTLSAIARDAAGNTSTASITVTVANDTVAPTVTIRSPVNAETVKGTIDVTADASDNKVIDAVEFRLDGATPGVEDPTAPYSVSWDTTNTTDGAHTLSAIARDASGNTSTASVTVTVSNDTTPPAVSIDQATDQADPTSASPINFTVVFSEPVSGFTRDDVTFTGTAGGTTTVAVTGGPSTYTVAVSGMTSGTVVATIPAGVAVDAAGNANTASTSTDHTVTFDTTPPTVSITSPRAASPVSGTIPVSADASDNVGVVAVEFRLDGAAPGTEDPTAPYSISWDTTTTSDGPHTLTAVAKDAVGNTSTASVTVTVSNDTTPPAVSIDQATDQADPTNVSPINFTVVFSEPVSGFTGADVTLTGTAGGTTTVAVTGGPSTYNVAVSGMTSGTVVATIPAGVAVDAAGNANTASTSTDHTVTFDTAPPTVSITSPRAASPVSGTIPVSADASDDVGVVGVQFRLDGDPLGPEDTAAPYSVSWDTTTTTDGAHTVTAVVKDAVGNTSTASVTVTVSNDTTPPAVSIDQATDQADPTNASPINFTVVFSEPVSGFTGADVTLTGTAGGTTTVAVTGGPSTYNVAVSGMTSGTVVATIPAGVAQDAAGNANTASTSTDHTVTFDTTPPTVAITSPANGSPVSGTRVVSADASDNVGVVAVEFRLDGAAPGMEDPTAPYSVSWDTTSTSDGPHTLTAVARDAAGNTSTASVTVTVSNDTTSPTVSITSPANGSTVSGTTPVSADASDDVGVVGVQFRLDGDPLGPEDTAAPYSVSWDTTTTSNGPHTLTAVARDAGGNSSTASVTVTVSNGTPP